jgi:hypothetical protein
VIAPRGLGITGRGRTGAAGTTVQLKVLWQLPQSSVVLSCWTCFPIAVMPLWQLWQVALSPKWLNVAAAQVIVP